MTRYNRPSRADSFGAKVFYGWLAWALLLVGVFAPFQWVGWRRTLITTEIWALYYAGRPWDAQFRAIQGDLVHPPLIYLLERGWLWLFGSSDSTAKVLPLVISIPTLLLFTWLARQMTSCWRLASFLFGGAYFRSAANQIRMYGLALLLTVLAIALWESWREKSSIGRLCAWTAVMVLLVYTHMFGLLFLVAFAAINWLYGSRRWVFTMAAAVPALAFLPWLIYVFPVYQSRGLDANLTWVTKQPHRAALQLPYLFLGPIYLTGLRPYLITAAAALHLLLVVLAWKMILRVWPPGRSGGDTARWFWTLVLLVGVPVGLLFLFSVAVTPAFQERFILGVLPAYWALLVSLGYFGGRAGRIVLYGAIVPWVLVGIGTDVAGARLPSPAHQGTLILSTHVREGDLILCEGQDLANQVYWEWTRRLGRSGRIEALQPWTPVARLSILPPRELTSLELGGIDRLWFVSDTEKNRAQVAEFLTSRGFARCWQLPKAAPFVLGFARKCNE